ncbi:HvfB family MNIO-type RiPP peptide maturase [Marinimicrobium sp. C2-29]|uniref:HvfB family MNIO-type RiPP peptide maturase n=1 Tax=Marinimicrobium sp. C2-29 TaxID=3139825 RepID=UPI0031395F89
MTVAKPPPDKGVGLGLRRELLSQLPVEPDGELDFLEVAPENWMALGGRLGKQFRALTERYTFTTHGLSLSLGSPAPLDTGFVQRIKQFLDEHRIALYTEHLSACSDDGHLYDLMPVPFTEEGVRWIAGRIRQVQDILERRIAVENVSYYTPVNTGPAAALDEATFIQAVLAEADCDLLLDVNNVYVNSINHRYDPEVFIRSMPADRVHYMHIAGHYREAEDLLVDTHGADVVDPVWHLLDVAYDHVGACPTLLERDFNIPPLPELLQQTRAIRARQSEVLHVGAL